MNCLNAGLIALSMLASDSFDFKLAFMRPLTDPPLLLRVVDALFMFFACVLRALRSARDFC
jgi:hypothetical protein